MTDSGIDVTAGSAAAKNVGLVTEYQRILSDKTAHINDLTQRFYAEHQRAQLLEQQLAAVQGSFWWRATKPMRFITRSLKKIAKSIPGLKGLLIRLRYGSPGVPDSAQGDDDSAGCVRVDRLWDISDEDKKAQTGFGFDKDIKISILVPLYNTPEIYLKDLTDSVINQTYTNWELCFADGSDRKHKYIEKICSSYAAEYKGKILYRRLKENLGISDNTNECIKLASGDYFALLDHDDALHPSALFENMKAICNGADFIYSDECKFKEYKKDAYDPYFKPDFAPDTLRGNNYICHLSVFSRKLLDSAGTFNSRFNGSQDYDLILRLTERASMIVHIPKVLYFWRSCPTSTAYDMRKKNYCYDTAVNALDQHLARTGLSGKAYPAPTPGWYRIRYELTDHPLVSIVIPNMDNFEVLNICIQSILNKTSYHNYEIAIIENNSKEPETFEYYKILENNEKIKIIKYESESGFNYSSINNFAVSQVDGEYVVLLNNDTEIIFGNWLEEMLMFAQRSDVGAVGAMLYYPDDTVQHAGAILGMGGVAGHIHYKDGTRRGDSGHFGRLLIAQNMTCVTAACMMLRKSVFTQVGGLNEEFILAFNDIDLCMRIRKAGYLIIWTPYAELYHHESKTRGFEDTPEKQKRFQNEVLLFMRLWEKELEAGDPYYNVNLSLDRTDFAMK